MSLKDRESNRRNSVVGSIISSTVEGNNESTIEFKEEKDKDKKTLKARSYYLTEELYKAVGLKSALGSTDKSTVVRAALTEYLKDILEQYK